MITTYSNTQKNILILMRLLIGWHFLYEGVIKLYNPLWTSQGYLASSEGPFAGIFQWMATGGIVSAIDTINIAILMIVGLTLIAGIMEKWGAALGAFLLILYYLSHPALPGLNPGPAEGTYFIINKNLIEAAALGVLYAFPTAHLFGLKRLFNQKTKKEVTT
jgi:thiosulfate dehydrogenase [quinone] large subunit